jgi:hypothetical protein
MRRSHLRNETTTRRWPNRISYRNAWLTLQVVAGRSDEGGYLHLKFRAALQSFFELFTLIGYLLLEVFDVRSHTPSINPFCFSVFLFTLIFRIWIRTWRLIGLTMTTNRVRFITFRLPLPTGDASSTALFFVSRFRVSRQRGR